MPGKDFNSDLNEEDEEFMKELATIEKNMNKMDAGGKSTLILYVVFWFLDNIERVYQIFSCFGLKL